MSLFIVGHEPGVLGELVMWVPGKAQTAGSKSAIRESEDRQGDRARSRARMRSRRRASGRGAAT
jgi:hypothetical protein